MRIFRPVADASRSHGWLIRISLAATMLSVGTLAAQTADLMIVNAAPGSAHAGGPLAYTITATNNGPSDDTAVRVIDSLPFGVTFQSAAPSQGTCSGTSTITCALGTLASGASANVGIVVVPGATGTITNTTTVSGALTDPNPSNNSSSVSTTVAPACSYSISSQEQTFSSAGGTGAISVTASDPTCNWTASTTDSWIVITAGGTGSGDGTVNFSVSTNSGGTRGSMITVAAQTFVVVEGGKSVTLGFAAPISYALDGSPTALATADFNHDGKIDVAVAVGSGSANQIEMLLSSGNGTFSSPASFNVPGTVSQLAAVDVNADGWPDLVALVGGNLAVVLNNGKGTFSPPAYYGNGSGSYNMAVGDFFRDGRIHIATASGNRVYIYQNLGNGQFVASAGVPIATGAYWVAAADLNGDGYADFAVAGNAGGYSILLNNGDGTFGPPVGTGALNTEFVSAADINGDGLSDLILSGYGNSFVSVLLNEGTAKFSAPVTVSLGSATVGGAVTVSDIDGDDRPDMVIAAQQNIGILRNLGKSLFEPPVFANGSRLGYNPTPFSVTDVNNDGRLDIVTPDTQSPGSFIIFISQTPQVCGYAVRPGAVGSVAAGTTGSLTVTAASGCPWTAVSNEPWITITAGTAGKGNGTVSYTVAANADVARVGAITAAERSVSVTQAGGLPLLQFGTPSSINLGGASASAAAVTVGDFNRDGKQDMAVALSGQQLVILLGKGDGTFAAPVPYSIRANAVQLIAADVNADGFPDLLVLIPGNFGVMLNNRDGTFGAPVYQLGDYSMSNIATADFYHDGRVHVAAAIGNGVLICQNLGNGQFVQAVMIPISGGASWVAAADLNGDGYADLAVADNGGYSIILNNRNGTFATPVNGVGFDANFVAAADVNGDGKPDLMFTNGNNNVLNVLLNQGDGTFAAPVNYPIPPLNPLYGSPVVADLDGDGRPDLLIPTIAGTALMRNLGGGAFEQEGTLQMSSGPSYPTNLTTIDLKGDGHLSVVTPNPAAGSNAVLLFLNTTPQVCGYGLMPGSVLSAAAGATGSLTVTAASGCPWTAVSSEPWITITAGTAGKGNGTVSYTVAKNTDTARLGAIALANKLVAFTQASAVEPIRGTSLQLGDLGVAADGFVTGDFNRDGLTDYAIAAADGTLSVFLATTAGNFALSRKYSFGSGTPPIAADLNADGYPDLVLLTGGVSVSLNNGDGTFAAPISYPLANPAATSVTVGDFNANGHIGLAAVSVQAFGAFPMLNVFTNDGTGRFTAMPPMPLATGASFVTTADVNNDGYPDVITADGNTEGTRTISVLLNQKNGTFASKAPFTANAFTIVAGDLNGDGYPDLIVPSSNAVEVLFGIGDGTFGPLASYSVANDVSGLPVVGDWDGDGKPDIVVPAFNNISFLRNLGNGTFELRAYASTSSSPTTIAAADLNDDGKLDILANAGPASSTSTAYWLFASTTPQACGFSVSPSNVLLSNAQSTTVTTTVTASSPCPWKATSQSPWITVKSGGSGQGGGTVVLSIAANSATTGRVATLSVAGLPIEITQPGN